MSRYLILLPAPEAEWADLPPEEHEKGHRSHSAVPRGPQAGGHTLVTVSPLEPSDRRRRRCAPTAPAARW